MGRFIVVEGIDKSGKSSGIEPLAAALRERGLKVAMFAFPDRSTPIGAIIDDLLRGRRVVTDESLGIAEDPERVLIATIVKQTLFSLNRLERAEHLHALIAGHDVVISSRYALSGIAYGMGEGVPERALRRRQGALEAGLPTPDLTLVLLVPPEVAAARARADDIDDLHERDALLQADVAAAYTDLAAEDPSRIVLVDGTGAVSEVLGELLTAIEDRFPDLS